MTLDHADPPISIDDAIQYGRDDVLDRLEQQAQAEAKLGDSRALNALRRLIEACGYRRTT